MSENNTAIHVGNIASKESIAEAAEQIVRILGLPHVDNDTKRHALSTLSQMTEVKNVTISGCDISTQPTDTIYNVNLDGPADVVRAVHTPPPRQKKGR
jgi:hypothetical protein